MLKVENLTKKYSVGFIKKDWFWAIKDVSFEIEEGRTIGIVGESGSGKSTIAQCLVRLVEPSSGNVIFRDKNITALKNKELVHYRPNMQMIFQDPDSALDPCMTIGQSLKEALILRKKHLKNPENNKLSIAQEIEQLIEMVGLAKEHIDRYPHELSGGQNQRAVVARALSFRPSIIVADEPTASLDVSVQAQILQLLQQVQQQNHITMVLISHDMDIIRNMCEHVVVMYRGRVLEMGFTAEVLNEPQHPYTKMLLNCKDKKYHHITEEIEKNQQGCIFYQSCLEREEQCAYSSPELQVFNQQGHAAACIHCLKRQKIKAANY